MFKRIAIIAALAMITTAALSRDAVAAPIAANFIVNGGFDQDLDGWDADWWVAQDPSVDRYDNAASGSVWLQNAVTIPFAGGMTQCLRGAPDIPVTLSAEALLPTAGQAPGAFLYLAIEFHSDEQCQSEIAFESEYALPADVWQKLEIDTYAPIGTNSVKVYLRLGKSESNNIEASGYFDEIAIHSSTDVDGDSCINGEELGQDPMLGGDRDPWNAYDFFDVPTPALGPVIISSKNQQVSLADVLAVLTFSGATAGGGPNANGRTYDSDFNNNGVPDGQEYDRTPSQDPSKPWQSEGPDGAVSLVDVVVATKQTGHSCAA